MTRNDQRIARLKEKVALLPFDPGVYQFFDAEGTIIYVGKAKSLRKRVSSYFNSVERQTGKLRVLVSKIHDLKHIVVESESDALLLENNLIKNLSPRYNILLKDDKTYPWIAVLNEPFPRVVSTRRVVKDGSRYFGPYASGYIQKGLLELVRSVYQLRTCSLKLTDENIRSGRFGVCLEYHIGNCRGCCVGGQTREEYDRNIAMVEDILRGNVREVQRRLEQQMQEAASDLRFEQAQQLKLRLDKLQNYQAKTVVVSPTLTNLDALWLLRDEGVAYCNFLRVNHGAIISSFTLEMKLALDESDPDLLAFALMQVSDKVGRLSREVVVPMLPADAESFADVSFTVPQRGDKFKLLEFAEKNCRMYRIEQLKAIEKKDPERHVNRIMDRMKQDLYMDVQPTHIECFDNSNIQGNYPVASCVVFRNGKPYRSEYRHFNIKTVVGADDFASMREVIGRRYRRLLDEEAELPQLVVVDGGKGQLGMAYSVLQELGLEHRITLIGLAKRLEEVYFPGDSTPHYLDKAGETLRVLMHIRDEAHRFGITFHRNKRSAAFIRSELDAIRGIGEVSATRLLKRFKTMANIRAASSEELVETVGKRAAQVIADYFKDYNADTM